MSLSNTSIKNPVFAWMIMIGIIVFGIVAFMRLGISQLPDVDYPVVSISCSWEGAAPEVMETEITNTIEDAIMGIQGVQEVTSRSRQSRSSVTVQFDLSKNIDVALQEVQSSISRAQRSLPKDMDPPVINKSNPEDQPIIWLTLYGDKPLKYLMEYTRDYLKDQFSTIPGVGEVSTGGYVDPNLRVWLDADKMRRNELTVEDITSAIQSEHAVIPAGYIDTGRNELNVRVLGEAESTKEFSSIIIPARKGAPLWKKFMIGDVAEVEDGLANIRFISRSMGMTTVGLGIKKQRGTNAIKVAHAVKDKLKDIQKYLPAGLKLEVRFDTTSPVEESIREMYFVMILSVILTSVVCWLFLGSFSSALNVFLTIPMSICGTLFILYLLGFTLNTFTLLGLSLVIGIVVDDAIMMLENIARHRESGENKISSAIKGAQEITFAAIAATIAILAIFIPVIFMQGIIGKYFLQFGVTISVAVMISLLGALTLTPMYCAQFLKVGHGSGFGKLMDNFMVWLKNGYAFLLEHCLNHRWLVVITSIILFAGSIVLFNTVKKEFFPAQDQSRLMVRAETKVGSSIEYTDSVFKEVEKVITELPEVTNYFTNIGGDMVNSGMIMLTLKPLKERQGREVEPPRTEPRPGQAKNLNKERSKTPPSKDKKLTEQIELTSSTPGVERPTEILRTESKHKKVIRPFTQQELIPILRRKIRAVPGVTKISVVDPSLMGFAARRGMPIEFTLNGSDWDKLISLSEQMMADMEKTSLMTDIDSDFEIGMPEVRVVPDRQKAAERGVSITNIGNTINALIGGVRAGKYSRGGRRYDIRVQLVSADRSNVDDINKIWIRNNRGEVIRLSEVVQVIQQPSMLSISRKNRERAIRISANLAPGKAQGEALTVVESLGKKLPEGYKIVLSGSAQTFKESFDSLYLALILGIFVAYMVLGTQFNSFVHPFTVLIALPFSISGAVLAMMITGQSLNMYSAIGMILLMGIVKKNSILLVDFTNQRRESGMDVKEALKSACPVRLRPIIMTSFSTIAAALPPALSIGPGAETRIPMATVVIGGVLVSTLLTLFVVPCVYSIMSVFESRKHTQAVHEALKELSK